MQDNSLDFANDIFNSLLDGVVNHNPLLVKTPGDNNLLKDDHLRGEKAFAGSAVHHQYTSIFDYITLHKKQAVEISPTNLFPHDDVIIRSITTVHSFESQHDNNNSISSPIPSSSNSNIDSVSSLLSLVKHKPIHVFQLKVLRQRSSATCGYHALYNAILSHLAIRDKNYALLTQFLSNREEFWYFYNHVRSYLASNALNVYYDALEPRNKNKIEDRAHWSLESILFGLIERQQMIYLIQGYKDSPIQLSSKDWNHISAFPEMGKRSIRHGFTSNKDLLRLNCILETFNQQEEYHHCFVFGSGNHWYCLVINKFLKNSSQSVKKEEEKTLYEVVYLDSRNSRLLNVPLNELLTHVKERLENLSKKFPNSYKHEYQREYFISNFYESLMDTLYTIEVLVQCLKQHKLFITEAVDQLMEHIVESFGENIVTPIAKQAQENLEEKFSQPEHVKLVNDKHHLTSYIDLLQNWFMNYFNPPLLLETLQRVEALDPKNVTRKLAQKCHKWATQQLMLLENVEKNKFTYNDDKEDEEDLKRNLIVYKQALELTVKMFAQ